QRVFARQPNKPAGGSLAAALRPRLPQLIAYAMILLMTASAAACLIGIGRVESTRISAPSVVANPLVWAAIIPSAITIATLLFFEPNEVGLHSFYRARLARAYLGASNRRAGRRTEEDTQDDFRVNALCDQRPLHLVCCAANDLDSTGNLENLHRGA